MSAGAGARAQPELPAGGGDGQRQWSVLSLTHPAGVTTTYSYPATSHRLSSVGGAARTYDNAGNTTQIGSSARQFVYEDNGRLSQVKSGLAVTMNDRYNGTGEQVRKIHGHGQ